jgi:hypothetical protein
LTEANAMQKKHFRHLKVVRIVLLLHKGSGKSTTIVLNVKRLAGATEESPRALIIVEDKAKVLEMESLLKKYGKNSI